MAKVIGALYDDDDGHLKVFEVDGVRFTADTEGAVWNQVKSDHPLTKVTLVHDYTTVDGTTFTPTA